MDVLPWDWCPMRRVYVAALVCAAFAACVVAPASAAIRPRVKNCACANEPKNERDTDEVGGELRWHTSYAEAHAEAKAEGRMLLVNFVPETKSTAQRELERAVETDRALQRRLQSMVLVRLPRDYQSEAEDYNGRLVDHSAFSHLSGRTGIAIIDLEHVGTPYYGKVVTALPFGRGKYYRWRPSHLTVALGLPPGTITQRTMIWAVRIHPESPNSTDGRCHKALTTAAERHSEYQARIGVQGHHRWDSRFHQVRAGAGAREASEVVAESWPNQNLIDSCIDCVASWRHSPGHWGAVRGRHRLFGYDIRRGRNGIWYGTGIFAN